AALAPAPHCPRLIPAPSMTREESEGFTEVNGEYALDKEASFAYHELFPRECGRQATRFIECAVGKCTAKKIDKKQENHLPYLYEQGGLPEGSSPAFISAFAMWAETMPVDPWMRRNGWNLKAASGGIHVSLR